MSCLTFLLLFEPCVSSVNHVFLMLHMASSLYILVKGRNIHVEEARLNFAS